MKTIARDGVSVYLFSDEREITMTEYGIDVKVAPEGDTCGEPSMFIIGDCYTSNAIIYENVNVPEDWEGGKYLFDGVEWTVKEL